MSMIVSVLGSSDVCSKHSPVISVSESDVSSRSNYEVAQIDIVGDNGKISRYWVSVRINRGRPTVEIATRVGISQVCETLHGSFNIDK